MGKTILICGDRHWKDEGAIEAALLMWGVGSGDTVIHGGARGADILGAAVAKKLGCMVISFPARWHEFGRQAGPLRNQEMLAQNPDIILAFHDWIGRSRGTRHMIHIARQAGHRRIYHCLSDRSVIQLRPYGSEHPEEEE